MSNETAPERIWACPHDWVESEPSWESGNWNKASDGMSNEAKYLRADGETVQAMVEALALAVSCAGPGDFWVSEARAALAAFKEGK